MIDSTIGLQELAQDLGQCITLVCDPQAEPRERWVGQVGFDAFGAGRTPVQAINSALRDFLSVEGRCQNSEEFEPLPARAPSAREVHEAFAAFDLAHARASGREPTITDNLLERADAAYERERDLRGEA